MFCTWLQRLFQQLMFPDGFSLYVFCLSFLSFKPRNILNWRYWYDVVALEMHWHQIILISKFWINRSEVNIQVQHLSDLLINLIVNCYIHVKMMQVNYFFLGRHHAPHKSDVWGSPTSFTVHFNLIYVRIKASRWRNIKNNKHKPSRRDYCMTKWVCKMACTSL